MSAQGRNKLFDNLWKTNYIPDFRLDLQAIHKEHGEFSFILLWRSVADILPFRYQQSKICCGFQMGV
jgi:hypothetical protein